MELQALALVPEDRQVIKFLASYDHQVIKMSRKLVSVNHDKLGRREDLIPPQVCNSLRNENGDNFRKGVDGDSHDLMMT